MKIRSLVVTALLLGAAGIGTLVACSSDSTTTTTTTSGTVTVHVTAAAGGTVSAPGGKASLAIPPGALAQDTDITLAVSAAANGSVGDVLDFGPDGLQFLKAATLTVKADGVTVPSGQTVSVAILEGSTWKAVSGSKFAGSTATADVMHFTKYSIILVNGEAVLQPPANCVDAIANFQACGGDPTGTWKFADFCIDPTTLGQDPFKGNCPQFAATADVKWDSVATISGTATAGTLVTTPGTQSVDYAMTFPLTCASAASDGGITACADISQQASMTCSDTGGGNCKCAKQSTNPTSGSNQTYTVSGNVFTTTDPTDNSTSSGEFCVKGGLMYYKEIKDGGQGMVWVLQKQ